MSGKVNEEQSADDHDRPAGPDVPAGDSQSSRMSLEGRGESSQTTERLIGRFQGERGRFRLHQQLLNNSLVRGDSRIADALLRVLVLTEAVPGEAVITQGGSDNDLYLVISGNLSVRVNGREVAFRAAGTHFGEMSLVDAVALRAATVTAVDYAVLARVPEHEFESIAADHPDLWRRLAIEISRRLQERGRLLRAPREIPEVFIGCSTEALEFAREIQRGLNHDNCNVEIWTDGIFHASSTPIEDLVRKVREIDFGIMLLTPDDQVELRGERTFSPRDNVVFELGLLIGSIGRERVLIVSPRNSNFHIPSDLSGVNPINYIQRAGASLQATFGPVCTEIRSVIRAMGSI